MGKRTSSLDVVLVYWIVASWSYIFYHLSPPKGVLRSLQGSEYVCVFFIYFGYLFLVRFSYHDIYLYASWVCLTCALRVFSSLSYHHGRFLYGSTIPNSRVLGIISIHFFIVTNFFVCWLGILNSHTLGAFLAHFFTVVDFFFFMWVRNT